MATLSGHTLRVTIIRPATVEDAPFLRQMLAVATSWRPSARVRSVSEIMSEPALAHYVAGWPNERDAGFVAEDRVPIGAAWWRLFDRSDRGYAFIDEATPELSIGVVEEARGRGVGTLLLRALIDEAQRRALPALSLSVEVDNPAASLYEGLGFETVGRVSGSVTMIFTLDL